MITPSMHNLSYLNVYLNSSNENIYIFVIEYGINMNIS